MATVMLPLSLTRRVARMLIGDPDGARRRQLLALHQPAAIHYHVKRRRAVSAAVAVTTHGDTHEQHE